MISETAAPRVTLADLQVNLGPGLEQVRDQLCRLIEADFGLIAEVNSHLLRMQGKLFRPTLLLLVNRAFGSRDDRAVQLAAVVELIHLATLVHDDSVDHSVLRRGMPTINSLFSHQISVIMGDYLYSRAVIELVRIGDLAPLEIMSRVTNEMTIGEMRQLVAHDPLTFSEESYDLLIRAKTASLISGACECGALKASPTDRAAMARFGNALGMAFQITDDLLDMTEVEAVTGKPSGHDLKEHKVTLPLIYALPRLSPAERSDVNRLMAASEPATDLIATVVEHVRAAGGIEYALNRALEFGERALTELEQVPAGPDRDALRASVTFVMERRK
jgi:octaprenyl-diphosphate synthase